MKNYYIGILCNNGQVKFVYKLDYEEKCAYWKSFEELLKDNERPLKFANKSTCEQFVTRLCYNGNVAFMVVSQYDFREDLKVSEK